MKKMVAAFTLIEMLIVIVIIGILASALVPRLISIQSRARDTKRIVDLNNMHDAIEMYFLDNGKYPWGNIYALFPYTGAGATPNCGYANNRCLLETLLSPYITSIPYDQNPWLDRRYLYKHYPRTPEQYGIKVTLENTQDASKNDGWFYTNRYELGWTPSYCHTKYTWSDGTRDDRTTDTCKWWL